MLTEAELARVESTCRPVPLTSSQYVATDFVMALFDTVLDYQNHVETIRKAGEHFKTARWDGSGRVGRPIVDANETYAGWSAAGKPSKGSRMSKPSIC